MRASLGHFLLTSHFYLLTSNFPSSSHKSSPEVAIIIYLFNVFCTPRWRHRGSSFYVSSPCTGFPIRRLGHCSCSGKRQRVRALGVGDSQKVPGLKVCRATDGEDLSP